jgi:hypothetical protein
MVGFGISRSLARDTTSRGGGSLEDLALTNATNSGDIFWHQVRGEILACMRSMKIESVVHNMEL